MTDALAVRREYRLQEWAKIVARCRESGIPEKTFYNRFRQLREAAIDQAPRLAELEDPAAPKEGSLRIRFRCASLELPENLDIDALAALLRSIQSC